MLELLVQTLLGLSLGPEVRLNVGFVLFGCEGGLWGECNGCQTVRAESSKPQSPDFKRCISNRH